MPQGLGEGNGGYSTTNVQVAGVDEPDTIKTDGERILTIMNGILYYVDVDGAGGRLAGSLTLPEGWNHRFFMAGDRALVFSQGDGYAMPLIEDAARIMPTWNGPVTLVHEVDLSNPAAMRIVRTLRLEGGYLSARAIDGTVRMVISAYPSDLPFVYPSGPAAEDLALETNERVIEQSTLEDWLPSYTLLAGDEVMEQGLLVDCEQTHRPAEFAGFDTLSVVTLDLEGRLDPSAAAAVIADGETVYASTERLYVATNVWVPAELIGDARLASMEEDYSTAIHAFDITGEGPARYLASGAVDGHLLNQFSMDEYEGHLRVATTDGSPWSATDASKSAVSVLAVDGERLVEVGRVGDLGQGREHLLGALRGPHRLRGHLPPDRPAVRGRPARPGGSPGGERTEDHRLLRLPAPPGRGAAAGRGPRGHGGRPGHRRQGDPVRRVRPGRPAGRRLLGAGRRLHRRGVRPPGLPLLGARADRGAAHAGLVEQLRGRHRPQGRRRGARGRAASSTSPTRPRPLPTAAGSSSARKARWSSRSASPATRAGFGGNYYCEAYPADQAPDMLAAYGLGEVEIGDDERLEICWPNYYGPAQITRSLVIGDSLWTLSWIGLQANAIDGFEVTGKVRLG